MRSKIKETVSETENAIQSALQEFLMIWETQAEQAKEHLRVIAVENVAEIGLEELKVAKRRLNGNIEASLAWMNEFESKMESIESERAQKLVNELKEAGNQLRSLKFERSEVIQELLTKETEPLNMVLIQNREVIFKFVHNLSLVLTELQAVAKKYCNDADTNWNQLRYSYVFPQFQRDISSVLDVDFHGFYKDYQRKFDSFSDSILEEASIVSATF